MKRVVFILLGALFLAGTVWLGYDHTRQAHLLEQSKLRITELTQRLRQKEATVDRFQEELNLSRGQYRDLSKVFDTCQCRRPEQPQVFE